MSGVNNPIPHLPKDQQEQILSGPALAPPNGTVSNFDNPSNENGLAIGVMSLCIAVSSLCLLIRGYLAVLARRVTIPEVLIVVGYGCYVGWSYCCFEVVYVPGLFVHQWDVVMRDMIPLAYYVYIAGVLYSIVLPCLKIAILVEWMEMFTVQRNLFWWTCIFLIFLQTTTGIVITVLLNFVCIPNASIYDLTVAGVCNINKHSIELASASIHLFTDAVMLFLPQKVIWGLNMSVKKKLGVAGVFGLGVLAVISAINRVAATVIYADATDVTYTLGPVIFWAFAEMTCGFVISCLPAAPKLVREHRVFHRIKAKLGMKLTTARSGASGSNISRGTTLNNTQQGTAPGSSAGGAKAWRKIEDESVQLGDMTKSDSTEYLQHEAKSDAAPTERLRATTVTVKQEVAVEEDLERATNGLPYGADPIADSGRFVSSAWHDGPQSRGGKKSYYGNAR
ncbi:hypothetical protein MCOR25_006715 [Pyricularia grisea]|uniref:Rhodopsin domain-containing protein n=1 Tax=Pyricularia grisea TaxID=148305 RepID=A0A6P8AQ54_PYRGI|nr:hypothetical protein PgNI_11369 [Pyricularia grisea]KAI6360552.1 hypothetical protein MCOR25_006715 [Pyricularia grisea]TLD04174.1 hypothetical protein PgNI_11369 [Pyricularia grisea]